MMMKLQRQQGSLYNNNNFTNRLYSMLLFLFYVSSVSLSVIHVNAFVPSTRRRNQYFNYPSETLSLSLPSSSKTATATAKVSLKSSVNGNNDDSIISDDLSSTSPVTTTTSTKSGGIQYRARDLIKSLIEDDECFTTVDGIIKFCNVCTINCVYEDRYEGQPIVGRIAIQQHLLKNKLQNGRTIRIDKISDGTTSCGYAWTYVDTTKQLEGLRGTTFIELNKITGEIQFICEIPEPLFKPNDLTKELLKFISSDIEVPITSSSELQVPPLSELPTIANEIVKYLFIDIQKYSSDRSIGIQLCFDENIFYRDFNYDTPFIGIKDVIQFVSDFNIPGLIFNPLRFDDGITSTCFTWELCIGDIPDTIKGISFYEIHPITKKIIYVRDIPESSIKPPPLGAIAKFINPILGVLNPVPLNSRPGGM